MLGGKESKKEEVHFEGVRLRCWWIQVLVHVVNVDKITEGECSEKKIRLNRVA